jgi:hypothetical protein
VVISVKLVKYRRTESGVRALSIQSVQYLLRDKGEKVVITNDRAEMERLLKMRNAVLAFDSQHVGFTGFFPDGNIECFVIVIQNLDESAKQVS